MTSPADAESDDARRAEPSDASQLLDRLAQGEHAVEGQLYAALYDDLHRQAQAFMRRQSPEHTLQPTDLIHEAWLRLLGPAAVGWQGRGHFLRVAARAMRCVLVDHARARSADKRGGGWSRLPIDDDLSAKPASDLQILALDDALARLKQTDEQLHRIAELRIFGGLSHDEIGRALGVSTRTVERAWQLARDWIARELHD